MPLLMCPNDNDAMQTLERGGVHFDMCPSCRGVWLDRGELENLMAIATADGQASVARTAPQQVQAPPPQSSSTPWGGAGYREERRDDRYRHDDEGYRYKKKKRDSIFDIFD